MQNIHSITRRKPSTKLCIVDNFYAQHLVFLTVLFVGLQLTLKVSERNKLIYMLQKHNVQFVTKLGNIIGFGRAAPSRWNH